MRPNLPRCKTSRRRTLGRGAVLLVVLVASCIAGVVLVAILRLAADEQRALRAEQCRAQADWLAESGLERAAARLAANPGFTGERWTVAAEQLGGRAAGSVTISILPLPGQPARRTLRVVAEYPDQSQDHVRRSREVVLDLSQGAIQR